MLGQCLDLAVMVAVDSIGLVQSVVSPVVMLVAVVDQVVVHVELLVSMDSVVVDLVSQELGQVAFDQQVLVMSESDQAVRVVFDQGELGLEAFGQAVDLEHLCPVELDQVVPVDDNLEHEDHHEEHLPSLQLLLQSLVNLQQSPNIPNFYVDVVEKGLHRSIFLKDLLTTCSYFEIGYKNIAVDYDVIGTHTVLFKTKSENMPSLG